MAFTGFPAEGIDLLVHNRIQNSKEFYEAHKTQIKEQMLEPFYRLCEEMTPLMTQIDPAFVTVPNRMVARVRRDTRFTKDKSLYRANLWLFFRRVRNHFERTPMYYFELHPEHWGFGCWGAWDPGEMDAVREMILREDQLFLDAYRSVQNCPDMHLAGNSYKRPKFPDAKPEYQVWLNAKELGVDFQETQNYAPVLNGSFVPSMLDTMQRLTPFYRFLLAAKERAKITRKRKPYEIHGN